MTVRLSSLTSNTPLKARFFHPRSASSAQVNVPVLNAYTRYVVPLISTVWIIAAPSICCRFPSCGCAMTML